MSSNYTIPQEHGILVVFSGPSGAGKGTILKRYFEDNPPAVLSVSATTRPPRPGEVDGVHYHFVTRAEFERMIAENGVLEYNVYNGNYYGSPRGPIEEELRKGHDVILEIETNGAGHIRRMFPSALSIFVLPPTFEELKKRLIGRGTESPEEIQARLEKGRKEIEMALDYDYIVVNDQVEQAAQVLDGILRAERCESPERAQVKEEHKRLFAQWAEKEGMLL